jgi:nitric oxide reductase
VSSSGVILLCCMLTLVPIATLWQKLPNLKLAIPFEEVKYSPPTKDVGIIDLPVVF